MKILKKFICVILVIASIASFMTVTASAAGTEAYGAATVKATSLNIRAGQGTDTEIVGSIPNGEIVVILDKTSDDWYHINYEGTVGYVASRYLVNELKAENFNATGTVRGTGVRCRVKPSTSYDIVGVLTNGGQYTVVGINNGWYKIKYDSDTLAYVRSDYMDITGGVGGSSSSSSSGSATPSNASAGQKIADFASQYVGYSYVYGEESPSRGFDCSGLVYYTLTSLGYTGVERRASMQYKYNGTWVSKDELLPGDLVFFSSDGEGVTHVGIYIGNNNFVHASTSKTGVIISSLTSSYYTRVYYGAKRVAV